MVNLAEDLRANAYPGRGIILGKSADGKHAVIAYFIMGRSANSRNRVFVEEGAGIRTQAYDPSKVVDPSLIIYAPVRVLGTQTIVTNGDQTDTIYDFLKNGRSFSDALKTREFEPDVPNYTPRISGIVNVKDGGMSYELSILKSADGNPGSCRRYTFTYLAPLAGQGHMIHTYSGDGNPLPSYVGEPKTVEVANDIDTFTDLLWTNLNEDNKVSLFVRYIDIADGSFESRIMNKNQ